MEFSQYINQKKEIYNFILNFIGNIDEKSDPSQDLDNFFKSKKSFLSKDELRETLRILTKISKNHHHSPGFYDKINRIIKYFLTEIKQTFSNSEIFRIFKSNKLLVLYLIEEGILILDKSLIDLIIEKSNLNTVKTVSSGYKYHHFFSPEINAFIEKNSDQFDSKYTELFKLDEKTLENFDEKRKKGENELTICDIIRSDSVDNFISQVRKSRVPVSSFKIKPSLFETNSLLLKNEPTLIEYSAFSGSIQIFQYLLKKNISIRPTIIIYAIHSNEQELIKLFDDVHLDMNDKLCEKCYEEAIKCHHNKIAELFLKKSKNENEMNDILISECFHYFNFEFFPTNLEKKSIFYLACHYNYMKILQYLLNEKKVDDINAKIMIKDKVI